MHRTATINEISARYTKLPKEWYIPLIENLGVKSKSNKQGRDIDKSLPVSVGVGFCDDLDNACEHSYRLYEKYLDHGVPPELARSFLHVNHYTSWVYKMDLRNILNFLSLRMHEHAQFEAREYADALFDILKQHLPASMAWLEENMQEPPKHTCPDTGLRAYIKRIIFEGV